MKKTYVSIITAAIIGLGSVAVFADTLSVEAYINNSFKYIFNDRQQPLPQEYRTLVYNGRSYVPARFVAESLGATVDFNDDTKEISFDYISADNLEEIRIENEEYRNRIEELEDRIVELEQDLESKDDMENILYNELPITQRFNDYQVILSDFDVDTYSNYSFLSVYLENIDNGNSFKISPLDTVLSINGKEYKPSASATDTELYNYIKREESKSGSIAFKDLPDEFDQAKVEILATYTDGFREVDKTLVFYIEIDN